MKLSKGPGAPVAERISDESREAVAGEIEKAGGNEVFFLGRLGEEDIVEAVEVLARGNSGAVPAAAAIAQAGDVVIHNHPNGLLVPSGADLEVASSLGAQGIGFYIVDNMCERVYAVVEPHMAVKRPDPLDPMEVAALFEPGGTLARTHPNYEERPAQGQMASDVAGVLESGAVGVLEAGTGTGKSLAYLVPAALWALRSNRRVVVATRTINLQEQILDQDLPILEEALGVTIKAVLIKGRGNYCCLRKRDLLEGDVGNTLLELDDLKEIQQLLAWSRTTADGTLSDLPFVPADANWSNFRAESDSCTRARCSNFSDCFFYRARLEASSAQLLLANHHILFADLSLREGGHESAAIMPRYEAVILDEAHNVEDVAISYFEEGLSRRGLMAHLGRLVNTRNPERGLAPFLRKRIGNLKGSNKKGREDLAELVRKLTEEVGRARGSLDTLFEDIGEDLVSWLSGEPRISDLRSQISKKTRQGSKVQDPGSGSMAEYSRSPSTDGGGDYRWRIPLERREELPWQGIQGLLKEMVSLIGSVVAPLRKVNSRIRELVDEGHDDFEHVWGDLAAAFSRMDAAAQFLKRILEGEDPEEVFWVQVRGRSGRQQVSLHLTPLDVAPILEQTLFTQVGAVVMTSATLTVSGSFNFFDRQLGLDCLSDREIRHWTYPTPFDLGKQMRLAVLDSLPDPGSYGFTDALSGAIRDLVLAAGGGTLVLFTSYKTLSAVHESCSGPFEEAGIHVMRQGEAQRSVLLERFRADPDSVLFATDSFWEGVDVVGTSLRLVIIARLPFPVPTDPINEARSQILIQQGREPFYEDSVPRAVIRFRQGVGRLIRHRFDRGYVVICDGRVVRRSYGRIFLNSVGAVDVSRVQLEDLTRDIEQFLFPVNPKS
ncbi:MAG: ATP-dependent DNA helicase [bacterium]|nr:ATP-dependent DNA helicase [bacterium]MDT8365971.1 ATP-dependent DNA helicase [bacterium]